LNEPEYIEYIDYRDYIASENPVVENEHILTTKATITEPTTGTTTTPTNKMTTKTTISMTKITTEKLSISPIIPDFNYTLKEPEYTEYTEYTLNDPEYAEYKEYALNDPEYTEFIEYKDQETKEKIAAEPASLVPIPDDIFMQAIQQANKKATKTILQS